MKNTTVVLALAVLAGIAFPIGLVVLAYAATDGAPGFPIDDPWIHLTYARNLIEHGSFTYFPGDPASAGSTAPLYTSLVALGMAVCKDEKLLSYVLGVAFHAAFLVALAGWARRRLESSLWAAAVVLWVAFDPRVGIIAVSGMETSLFLAAIALAFYAVAAEKPRLAGVALGLSVWVRPDGLLLLGVFVIDAFLRRVSSDKSPFAWRRVLFPAGALIGAYVAFNLAVGGTWLPNTFAAKKAFYRSRPTSLFLSDDVVQTFASHAWAVVWPVAAVGAVLVLLRTLRRRDVRWRPEVGWVLALVLAYFVTLPYAHLYQRYLLPALPALAVAAAATWQELVRRLPSPAGAVVGGVLLVPCGLQAYAANSARSEYPTQCEYFRVRHERTGRWLADNTPASAVIATHDVGAIAFYSRRRIVDIVGIVLPEAVRHLNQPGYANYLVELFEREGVTHLAFLRNWMEVSNVEPLFRAHPEPEHLEVFDWRPGVTHLVEPEASDLSLMATRAVRAGDPEAAIALLQQSAAIDDQNARTFYLLGDLYYNTRQLELAITALRRATKLQSEFATAQFRLSQTLYQSGKKEAAYRAMTKLLVWRPDYPNAAPMYESLARELGKE